MLGLAAAGAAFAQECSGAITADEAMPSAASLGAPGGNTLAGVGSSSSSKGESPASGVRAIPYRRVSP